MSNYRNVTNTQHEQGREQRLATFKATQLIWLFLGILEALIALRVVFKLIGVNGDNAFASFLYSLTHIFVGPFASLVGAPAAGGMVLEISSVLAMIIYFLIAWGIERIVYVAFYRPRGPMTYNQTVVDDHIPQQAPLVVNQQQSSNRITSPTHTSSSQTTTTEAPSNRPPGS
jgi:hypothetical protein